MFQENPLDALIVSYVNRKVCPAVETEAQLIATWLMTSSVSIMFAE